MTESMEIKIKLKNTKRLYFLIIVISLTISFSLWQKSKATESSIADGLAAEAAAEQAKAQKKIDELEKKADVYREIIDIKKKQSETLNNQLELTDANIDQIQNEIEISKKQIDDFNSQIVRISSQIREKEETMKNQREILSKLLQAYYEVNLANPIISYLGSGNIASFMVKKDMLSQTGDKILELVAIVNKTKTDLEQQNSELDLKKGKVVMANAKLESQGNDLETIKKQKAKLLTQTEGEEARYKTLLEKVQEQIQGEIEQIELEKAGVDLGPLPPSRSGLFAYPVNPVKITQQYGKTSFSKNYSSGLHNGVDFGVNRKSVYAVGDGTILETGDNGRYAYGKWVAVDHGNGLVSLYGHFSSVMVSRGGKIKSGGVLGISGNTGFSTGPHLHLAIFAKKTFELIESKRVAGLMLPTGATINPMNYL